MHSLSSKVAFRAFERIMDAWGCSSEERIQLLGVECGSYRDWSLGASSPEFSADQLTTISKLINIYDGLHRLFGDKTYADRWVKIDNLAFDKEPALTLLLDGADGVDRVFRLVMEACSW